MVDSIDRMEIDAYIDGELDPAHRLMIEDYLSHNPLLAARVMADLRDRSALRLLAHGASKPSRCLAETAERILKQSRPSRRFPAIGLIAAASIATLAGTTLLMSAVETKAEPPSYVGLAAATHRSMKQRTDIAPPRLDSGRAEALLSASRMVIPKLPSDWRIVDAEMVRPAEGLALVLAVQPRTGPALSLLAIRAHSSAPSAPDTVRHEGQSVAYWRRGDFSYSLTGQVDARKLDAEADVLAASWSR